MVFVMMCSDCVVARVRPYIWLMDRGEASGEIFPPVMKAKPYFLASGAGAFWASAGACC